MNIGSYSVEVLIHGKAVREFNHYINGEYKTFIEGRHGTRYSIRVKNHSGEKLLAISSVDGLSVVSGKPNDGYKGRGYIIQPYGEVTIKGFRESDNTVGSFMFTSKGDSYASEKSSEKNCGIIAVNLINEKPKVTLTVSEPWIEPLPPYNPWPKRPYPHEPYYSDVVPIGSSAAETITDNGMTYTASLSNSVTPASNFMSLKRQADFDLGTNWGERVEDKITRKSFDKNIIVASFRIYYATRQSLENMGINFYSGKEINGWPEGFTNEYCKPPKNWNQ